MRTMAEALEESSYTDDLRLYREYDDEIIERNTPLTEYVKKATSDMISNTEPVSTYNERHIADVLTKWQNIVPDDMINPKHYKDIVPGFEYFDVMDYLLEGWEGPEAHAFGNALKYLFRLNKKDDNVQELNKSIWYLTRLKDYLEQGGYHNYREAKTKQRIYQQKV